MIRPPHLNIDITPPREARPLGHQAGSSEPASTAAARAGANAIRRARCPRSVFAHGFAALVAAFLAVGPSATAQLSLYSTVDLAMRNNQKIRAAEADVLKARAGIAQTKDVFIPNLLFGSSLGYFSGFPVGTPTLFSFTSQSLVFNFSQRDYIRAAAAELRASELSLKQVRLDVEEDTALAYMDLDRAYRQQRALADQLAHADQLVSIVQERLDAGLDDKLEMTQTRLTPANIRLRQLQNEDDIETLRDHLARSTGMNAANFATDSASIPAALALPAPSVSHDPPPSVAAAFADAKAKRETAFGDSRQLYRPEFNFFAQYNYFSGLYNYNTYYNHFQNNNESIGFQITLPLFDAVRRARARQSSAEALRLERNAIVARNQAAEGDLKLQHSLREQMATIEVDKLQQELAQDRLDAILLQLKNGEGRPGAPALTPKDEQAARIEALQRSIDLTEMDFALRRAQLDLMKADGMLEDWLRTSASTTHSPAPPPVANP